MGACRSWHKKKKKWGAWTNSCQKQFPITTSWWRLLFVSNSPISPPLAFSDGIAAVTWGKDQSAVRCPSQIFLIALGFCLFCHSGVMGFQPFLDLNWILLPCLYFNPFFLCILCNTRIPIFSIPRWAYECCIECRQRSLMWLISRPL